jgi:hypothetical protein
LDDLKEKRGYSHLKEEALDRTMWRARFGRDFGPVVRQTAEWVREIINTLKHEFHVHGKDKFSTNLSGNTKPLHFKHYMYKLLPCKEIIVV